MIRYVTGLLLFVGISAQAAVLNNAAYEVCFTPGGQCTSMIVSAINKADKSIDVQAYGFTSAPIVKALLQAKKRGVTVSAIVDKSNATHSYSAITTLMNNHIPVKIDSKVAIAHNKVMVIDGKTVITGSFNFTKSAQTRNAENVLIITDNQLAQAYLYNFNRRLKVSVTPSEYCMTSTKCKLKLLANDAWDTTAKTSESLYDKAGKLWDEHFGNKPKDHGYASCSAAPGETTSTCTHYESKTDCQKALSLCQDQRGQVKPWLCGACKPLKTNKN